MTRLIWVLGWIAVAIWSLFAFAAYGVVDLIGTVVARNSDMFSSDPETVEWIFHAVGWARSLSGSVILVAWGVVSLAILFVPWVVGRFARRAAVAPRRRPDGIVDLGPADYRVIEPVTPRTGPVPRVGPVR